MPFTLKLAIGPPGRRPEFPFAKGEARLGRTADNDLVVKDGDASRSHCRIYEKDGRFFIEDLRSANGTQLNGELLQDDTKEIRNGDTIGIGAVLFVFTSAMRELGPGETFDLPDTVARGGAGLKAADSDDEPSSTKLKLKYDATRQRPALRDGKGSRDGKGPRDARSPRDAKSPREGKESSEPKGARESWDAPPAAPSPPKPPRKPPPSTIRTDELKLDKSSEPQLLDSQDVEPISSQDLEPAAPANLDPPSSRKRAARADLTSEDSAPPSMMKPPLGGVVDSTARQPSPETSKLPPVDEDDPGTSHVPTSDSVPMLSSSPGESKSGESQPGDSKPGESQPGESAPGASGPGASGSGDSGAGAALAPSPSSPPSGGVRVRRSGALARKDDEESEKKELTAAEKARVRRQAQKTTGGRLAYAWSQLGLPVRGVISLLLLGILGIGGWMLWQQMAPVVKILPPPEPSEIVGGGPTIQASFGAGDGVTYDRSDMKVFSFKAVSPTQLVGLLHYQARDVSKEEVAITVNGFDLGFVPADSIDADERELEVVIPASQVKRGEQNQITFDNVRNPPGKEPWRVWNLWLELLALPDTSSEETLAAVKEDLDRAQKFFDTRDIGPDNLFKAWKGYRDAWLKLESLPGRPNDLYVVARAQQAEARRLMDKKCKTLQIDVQRTLSARRPDYDLARKELRDMLRYFPTREHPCHALVQSQLESLE